MRRVWAAVGLVLWAGAGAGALAGERPITVEDSLGFKSVGNFEWGPEGDYLVFTMREWNRKENRYDTHVHRVPAAGGEVRQLTRGEKSEGDPHVSPDGKYLAFTATRTGDKAQVYLLPLDGGEAFKLTDAPEGVSAYAWSQDGKRIAYTARDERPDKEEREKKKKDKFDAVVVDRDFTWTHLWTIDVDEKEAQRLTEGEFNVEDPRWSPDGARIAFRKSYIGNQDSPWKHIDDNQESDIFAVTVADKQESNLTPDPGTATNPRWSPDGQSLAFGAADGPQAKVNLFVMDMRTRRARNLTANDPDSVSEGTWSPDGATLYYTQGRGTYTHLFAVPSRGGDAKQLSAGLGFEGGVELSPNGQSIAHVPNDPDRPGDLWVSDLEGRYPLKLTDVNPKFTEFAVAKSEVLRWTAPDGLEIEGVLLYPLGYEEGKRYPLILQIHGGPRGRFTHSFNGRNQVFAANGYAILQPNPRGSTGYGQEFAEANRGDWGGNDFNYDDMTGVDRVIELGVADPEKLVVMGGSYGGFSTFWAVTQTDRFKAAIAHAAISEWYSFHGQTDIPAYLEYGFLGFPWESREVYEKWSPYRYAENVKTPLMITHGEEDRRVPIAQAEQFYTALKKMGKVVEFVRYPREGHGITEPNHVIDLMARQLEWFDRHLGIVREKPAEKGPEDGVTSET